MTYFIKWSVSPWPGGVWVPILPAEVALCTAGVKVENLALAEDHFEKGQSIAAEDSGAWP